jgi:hypothetical protein
LEERLERAARAEGVPTSEFIREAVRIRCDQVLGHTLKEELAEVIGIVDDPHLPPDTATRTGEVFKELLLSRVRR